jgi:cyclohexyl-isocyanide hydratase
MTLNIGFVLFPNVTQLDFTGPLQMLHRLPDARVHIVARTRDAVPSDCGLGLMPTTTFSACEPLDIVCVPGGYGVSGAIADAATVDFVRRQAKGAKYVTSVCTGAFVLGVAGLLRGRKATTHWAYTGLLPLVGATHEKARVVRDGNVLTGGGVTAGIDFALTLAGEVAGVETAQRIQLSIEYDPAPPFTSGNPAAAPAPVREHMTGRFSQRLATFRGELQRAVLQKA